MAFPFGHDRMPNLIGCVVADDGNAYVCESNPGRLEIRSLCLSQNTGEITYEKVHNFSSKESLFLKEEELGDAISSGVFRKW